MKFDMSPKVIYEDEYLVAIDKPSGLMVHADGRSDKPTLVDWILKNYPNICDVGEEEYLQNGELIKRPGIVHRLDKETSGVIIIAKTKESHQYLKKQFQDRLVVKNYHAIVWNNFPKMSVGESTTIDKPIGRSASDFRKWSAEFGAKGELREAITEFNLIAQNKEYAYLSIFPKTGRTHQIRVHMKSISHPVVCDKIYGPKKENNLGLERLALHALSIELTLPNGLGLKIESSLPLEFMNARSIIEK